MNRSVALAAVVMAALGVRAQALNLPLSVEDRSAESDAIVVARVVGTGVRTDREVVADLARSGRNRSPASTLADLRVPHRYADIEVEEVLSGKLPRRLARVLFALDGWRYTIGALAKGARVVLYLARPAGEPAPIIVNEPYGAERFTSPNRLSDGSSLEQVRAAARRAARLRGRHGR